MPRGTPSSVEKLLEGGGIGNIITAAAATAAAEAAIALGTTLGAVAVTVFVVGKSISLVFVLGAGVVAVLWSAGFVVEAAKGSITAVGTTAPLVAVVDAAVAVAVVGVEFKLDCSA